MAGGEYCAIWLGPELPGDQRVDDAKSACFDGAPLDSDLDIVGGPVLRMKLSADKQVAMVAVRLCDVQPDGASTRVTYGVMNLCHRNSREFPQAVVPGEVMEVALRLDDVAYSVKPGHRLRVAISSTYWPLVWPSPEPVTLTLHEAALDLPVRSSDGKADEWRFEEPEGAPRWRIENLRKARNRREVGRDPVTGLVTLTIEDNFGEDRDLEHGLENGTIARETWTIDTADPLSARGETHWTETLGRGDWRVRTETFTSMRSDAEFFHLDGRIEAFEGTRVVFSRQFSNKIKRDLI
jgi:hypothetical protein